MKKAILILLFWIFAKSIAIADEGMWLPMFVERLNYVDMQKMGLKLTAKEIYDINNSSLKDAIIQFGPGCTGEIVSPDGLLFTNHHCGYPNIQEHSTVEHDYLKDGFWAMNRDEELPNPGLTATFLVRMEDVTKQILEQLKDDMTETQRNEKAQELIKKITNDATAGTHYTAVIRSFFDGNEYYMFVYEIFKDVRLVGAPPSAIGKFGGDTDNWMWPRHTSDFSVFRVYSGPDGKPAAYSKNNIPLKPKHYLPISMKGVQKNDFAMVMGYPGTTDRYLTSYGVQLALEQSNDAIVKIRDKKLSIMREDMQANATIRIQYAAKYAQIANYWKYFIGQSKGLKRLKVYDKKLELENAFQQWVIADNARKEKYGEALGLIKNAYGDLKKYNLARVYYGEALAGGAGIIGMARRCQNLQTELKKDSLDSKKVEKIIDGLKNAMADFYKDFNAGTDQKLLAATFAMFYKDVAKEFHPDVFKTIERKFKSDFNKYAAMVFEKSVFASKDKFDKFLNAYSLKVLEKDPAFIAGLSISNAIDTLRKNITPIYEKIGKGNRLFVAGLREMQPDRKFYPNANSTMRLTFGKVMDYQAADAINYNYFTTIDGIIEKNGEGIDDYIIPPRLKELYEKKDFGIYAEKGILKTAFLTDNDITGGNSGSPVIDGEGRLIGIAFDGNWEAMSGNIAFEPELQRCINVDIRYVLWVIDKYAGATHLVKELTLLDENNQKITLP